MREGGREGGRGGREGGREGGQRERARKRKWEWERQREKVRLREERGEGRGERGEGRDIQTHRQSEIDRHWLTDSDIQLPDISMTMLCGTCKHSWIKSIRHIKSAVNFCQTLYIYLAFDTTTYVASAWQPVASAWQPVTHLRHKDKSHREETGEEDRHSNEGKTSVLVGANDEWDWSGDETQHLQQQQQHI